MEYVRDFKPVFIKKNIRSDTSTTKLIILERLCDKIYISMKIRIKARSILNYCTAKKLFPSTNSQVWATTCIWLAIRNDKNYSNYNHFKIADLAKSSGISVNSITDLKRQLIENGTLHLLSLSTGVMKSIANYVHEIN